MGSKPKAKKTYGQLCGVALALDCVGDRWTLLILRDLILGPRRFSDLLSALQGITTNLLSSRLKQLSADGLIEKKASTGSFPVEAYHLTPTGKAIEPTILALGQFGYQLSRPDIAELRGDLRWLVVNLKYHYFDIGESLHLNLSVGGSCFGVMLGEPQLLIQDDEFNSEVAKLTCSSWDMSDWAFGHIGLAELLNREKTVFDGNQRARETLLAAFPKEPITDH